MYRPDGHTSEDSGISLYLGPSSFTMNGPKKSIPTKVNGGLFAVTRSSGKLAIFCSAMGACLRRQLKHPDSSLRTAELALMSQNLSRSKDKTCSLPECPKAK